MNISPCTVENGQEEAYRQVTRGAREMMLRELVQNGIEAAEEFGDDLCPIRIYQAMVPGYDVPKLHVWNRGGMDVKTLRSFANINTKINKHNSIDGNFGRGAKIASLASNSLGMRYRTCKDGVVREVLIMMDHENKLYGPVEFEDCIDGCSIIRDVTDDYLSPMHTAADSGELFLNIDHDWTEVGLLGNAHDQDTSRTPYLNNNLNSMWIQRTLGLRFMSTPSNVSLRIQRLLTNQLKSTSAGDPSTTYRSLYLTFDVLNRALNHTVAEITEGRIHYIDMRNNPDSANQFRPTLDDGVNGFGGISWRNELHDLHVGTLRSQIVLGSMPWPKLALDWGIARASKHVAIIIELDDHVAINEVKRVHLDYIGGLQIKPEDFGELVYANRPQWLLDLDKSLEPKQEERLSDVREQLRRELRKMRGMMDRIFPAKDGDTQSEEESDAAGNAGEGQTPGPGPGLINPGTAPGLKPRPDGSKRGSKRRAKLDAPRGEWENGEFFDRLGHDGRAAFLQTVAEESGRENILFLNRDSDLYREIFDLISDAAPDGASAGSKTQIARKHAESACYMQVGMFVCACLSRTASGQEDKDQLDRIVDPAVLDAQMELTKSSHWLKSEISDARKAFRTGMRLFEDDEEAA